MRLPLSLNLFARVMLLVSFGLLRPAILDDLGLVQAIDWYAESRLKSQGIQVGLETDGAEKRLPSENVSCLPLSPRCSCTTIVRK